jgi:hypothetical protein
VVDQIETSIRSETLVFGEIQNDGLAVDAKADVFDGVVATVSERFCLDYVQCGASCVPVHRYVAGVVTPAPLSGVLQTEPETPSPSLLASCGELEPAGVGL